MAENENKDFENNTSSIHTLESDLASAVRDENYGKNIIKIVTDPDRKSSLPMTVGSTSGNHIDYKNIFLPQFYATVFPLFANHVIMHDQRVIITIIIISCYFIRISY